jgi:hypothetical protein
MQTSKENIDELLRIWAANNIAFHDGAEPIFKNTDELYQAIDDCSYGQAPWEPIHICYTGHTDAQSPVWKTCEYVVHTRNALTVMENMLSSHDFDGHWDYVPFERYTDDRTSRLYSHLMSG